MNAVLGYAIGAGVTIGTRGLYDRIGAHVLLPTKMLLGMFIVTLLMCLLAAFLSVRKAMTVEPAEVFR